MPHRIFPNPNKEHSLSMKTFLVTILGLVLLAGSFGAGYFTANRGYKVVDANGAPVVNTGNAAQTVKEENARLAREIIGKSEADAKAHLEKNQRTIYVGMRDNEMQPSAPQKTFTNCTVIVMNGKVTKVLGWY